ncbi:MAG: hypothetical protein AAF591_20465 [Verrucomicrobiota bacterium]
METLGNLTKALGNPEYLFLLIEPVFIYGILLGVIVFVIGFLLKDKKAQTLGLVFVIVSSFAIWPYLKFRDKAESRISKVYAIEDPTVVKGFKQQTELRNDTKWIFFALGGIAGVVLLIGAQTNRMGLVLGITTVVGGITVVVFSMSMHLKESQVFHPNLLTQQRVVQATVP